jgi:biotin synthase
MIDLKELKDKVIAGHRITKEDALILADSKNKEVLYEVANDIREKLMGDVFDLCSIINAKSGKCSENCKWCAQSSHFKTQVNTYDLVDKKTAVDLAHQNAEYGVNRYSFVTSGKAVSNKDLDTLCEYIEEVDKSEDIKVCASMGLLDEARLKKLQASGVLRYHCNIETSPRNFKNLCTTHTLEDKIKTIKTCQDLGLEVCSGGIIGMGETMEDRIDMAIMLRDLGIKSIPINILNPIPGTPLEDSAKLTNEDILTTIALFRIINPTAWLRFAGGRLLIADIQEKAMKTGVNAAITGDLLTTTGATVLEDIKRIKDTGFTILK